jgi:cation transporter-like permease
MVMPKLLFFHMMVAGQASVFLISIIGCVVGASITPVEDNHELLALVLIQVTFMCTNSVIWSLVQWRIVVQSVRRDLAPRVALVDTESGIQHK